VQDQFFSAEKSFGNRVNWNADIPVNPSVFFPEYSGSPVVE
jgi:hypothetical protein